jgi:hypothetical protein
MTTTTTTIRVYTAAGTNASDIGESLACEGVMWRNAVDGCDSDGGGRVFLDCDDAETAAYVSAALECDERITLHIVD